MSDSANWTAGRRNCALIAGRVLIILVAAGRPVAPLLGAEHVIHISVDGLQPSYLQEIINAGNAPNFKRFQTEGAWTNHARTDYTHTITLPNHTSMMTGRPVLPPTVASAMTHHGYTNDGDPPASETLHNFTDPDWYKASSFDVAHDAGLSTALYASKFKLIIYEQSYNAANGADHPNGRDKIDAFANPESSATMQGQLLAGLTANHFNYTFIHYADPDDAGHSTGWGSPTWRNAVITVDGYLGQLFNLVTTDSTFAGRTAIVLSADHGGEGTENSTASNVNNYSIPFYAWGAGVSAGDIYSFNNGERTNPGTSRPDYNSLGQPIRNGDSGNLAVFLLGLDAIPGSLMNSNHTMRVAMSGDYNVDNSVDSDDLGVWRANFGHAHHAHRELGDDNGDHDVDGADFLAWQRQVGAPASDVPNGQVPEPATLTLMVLAAAGWRLRRRRLAEKVPVTRQRRDTRQQPTVC